LLDYASCINQPYFDAEGISARDVAIMAKASSWATLKDVASAECCGTDSTATVEAKVGVEMVAVDAQVTSALLADVEITAKLSTAGRAEALPLQLASPVDAPCVSSGWIACPRRGPTTKVHVEQTDDAPRTKPPDPTDQKHATLRRCAPAGEEQETLSAAADRLQLSRGQRRQFGQQCKLVFDWSRALWLRQHGWSGVEMVRYVPYSVSLESMLIFATKHA
jgi:hypothetical protein